MTTDVRATSTANLTTSYSYDAANRIIGILYPSGMSVTYNRDKMGRITTVTALIPPPFPPPPCGEACIGPIPPFPLPVAANISYEPFGPYAALAYSNGVDETRSFDQDYRLTGITDTGSSTLQNLSYAYDPTNNVHTITDAVNSGNSQSFSYDNLQRLNQATGGYGSFGFTYDKDGNRLSQSLGGVTTTYGYGTANDLLQTLSVGGVQTQAIGYSADGRIATLNPGIQAPGGQYITSLSYNQDAQLSAVNAAGGALASYTYDAFGQRLIKTVSGTSGAIYQYGQNGMLLEETNSSGVAQADYIYLDGRPIATLNPSTGALYFLNDDMLGTPQLATDSGQAIAWQATYQPFGSASVSGTITQNLRFPGQYFDSESGWNHNGFRNYIPDLGRYAEPDPLAMQGSAGYYDKDAGHFIGGASVGFPGISYFYIYANNRPTDLIDPLGLQTKVPGSETPFWNPNIHHYNCLAWGLGINDAWIQPHDPKASPNSIMPLFGCTKVPCDQLTNCKKRVRVNVYEDSANSNNWHVERQTCGGSWTSKNGQSFLYNDIPDPDTFYIQSYHPTGTVNKTCWSCPSKAERPNDPRVTIAP